MIETLFTTARTVFLVAVVVPMMMGLVLSLLGFGALEWSRFVNRRQARKMHRAGARTVSESAAMIRASMVGADT